MACLSTCHALQICEDLQHSAVPDKIRDVRNEYEAMVRSKQEDAHFWGPGLMVFSTHKLVSQGVDQNVALRTLPCIQAAEMDPSDPSKYAYLGEWRRGWKSNATMDPVEWEGDAKSTNMNPRRAAQSVQKVAEEGVMARVGTHAFEVALALCTDPRLLQDGGHNAHENKDEFAKRLVGRMRWAKEDTQLGEAQKLRLVQQLLFGDRTPSYKGKGVFQASQVRETLPASLLPEPAVQGNVQGSEATNVQGSEPPQKRKRTVLPKYCEYSLLGRHSQALKLLHSHYPDVARDDDYQYFQNLTSVVCGVQATASSSHSEPAATSSQGEHVEQVD